ncbi:hypothetical protein HCU74_14745 [Spongiibacter sp. KMU-166]|uniref:DUF4868 domain-containing protein n=1 Tax=Spongiibacter thalassae TaxID=2721624 RepID=A0ABX1GKJ2_9GAMM|nr:hypothetical protein [Spongiibacter thalassae]NKI18669.1 hypothetical protein [Spongiibacter thalassae]
MKTTEYSLGEEFDLESESLLGKDLKRFGISFTYLYPQSSLAIHLNNDWVSTDNEDVGSQVRRKFAGQLTSVCELFIERFYPELDASVSVRNLTAKNSKIRRNQRTALFLVDPNETRGIAEKLSHVAGFVCSRVQQNQPDLFFRDESTGLLASEVVFLTEQIDELRKRMSGIKITHPFGVETLDPSTELTGFSGEFDKFEFELSPAEQVSGLAIVDGFREFRNTAYLTIFDSAEILEASKVFVVQDTTLFKKITEAKHFGNKIRYVADKVFEVRPDKPTFILKDIEIVG